MSPAATTPRYQVGELAEEDIFAPTSMAVVDPERTGILREQAAQRIPAVFRFHSHAVREAEEDLHSAFAETRRRFREAMESASQRARLDERTVAHPSFRRFVIWFQKQNPAFPMATNLARAWAMGEPDEAVLAAWSERLRIAMEHCIHGDWLPPALAGSLQHVRVVEVDDPGEVLAINSVESRGVDIRLTNLVSISDSRAAIKRGTAPEDDPAVGNFLSGFLRVNSFPEEDLTRRLREQGTTDMVAVDRYEAGQLIVRRGHRIDSRIRAALEFLAQTERTARARPVATVSDSDSLETGLTKNWWQQYFSDPLRFENATQRSLLLSAVLAMCVLLLLAVLVRRKGVAKQTKLAAAAEQNNPSYTVVMNEDRQETVFLPLEASTAAESGDALPASAWGKLEPSNEKFWRQRAAEAERHAEDILNMVRAGLAPQLARQMMNKLVQELITQRAEWLLTSRVAENELAEIERRFTASHTQLQKRLRDFEKRTEELEQMLAVKTEENSELIKSQIELTQKQLAESQDASDADKGILQWN